MSLTRICDNCTQCLAWSNLLTPHHTNPHLHVSISFWWWPISLNSNLILNSTSRKLPTELIPREPVVILQGLLPRRDVTGCYCGLLNSSVIRRKTFCDRLRQIILSVLCSWCNCILLMKTRSITLMFSVKSHICDSFIINRKNKQIITGRASARLTTAMMTSFIWKHFPCYWPFVREYTGHQWILLTHCNGERVGFHDVQLKQMTYSYAQGYPHHMQ